MTHPSSLIDPARLQSLLGATRGRFDVDALAECESTNTLLLQHAAEGAPSGRVVITDRQTAGRGSRGRQWVATPEASLTFSVLWRFNGGLEKLSGLSLAVGVAVVQALETFGAAGVALKWPNDILHEGAKLGGILIELHADEDGALAVIGIGLNLKRPEAIPQHAASLPPTALEVILEAPPERHALFARLLAQLAAVFDDFDRAGFAGLRHEWQARNAWQDSRVRLLRDGRVEMEGVCRGADEDGALLVETASGLERCLSGDLSLRPPC
ncbi:biotin--[acetyl-CoA-carboxylase] ligase [Propionivibrio limicola]|uniref:biotin--[acetyl-CoA-carboxylase] ligase n=1 Tax=Propionivibrio limicola TaxID=167645 RepID=UPI001291867E|nr:biotin--[acetyl-CoA-carboxylase] ligase [Propionivibrio limicola]